MNSTKIITQLFTFDEWPKDAFGEAMEEISPLIEIKVRGTLETTSGKRFEDNGDVGYPDENEETLELIDVYINNEKVFKDDYPKLYEFCEELAQKVKINYD